MRSCIFGGGGGVDSFREKVGEGITTEGLRAAFVGHSSCYCHIVRIHALLQRLDILHRIPKIEGFGQTGDYEVGEFHGYCTNNFTKKSTKNVCLLHLQTPNRYHIHSVLTSVSISTCSRQHHHKRRRFHPRGIDLFCQRFQICCSFLNQALPT